MDAQMGFHREVILKEVEAKHGVLAEIEKHLQQSSIRILRVEINDEAIPWVATELFNRPNRTGTLEELTDTFKRHLEKGEHHDIYRWKYVPNRGQGHVGVILMPEERTAFFGIIPDESGKRILRYRYVAYK